MKKNKYLAIGAAVMLSGLLLLSMTVASYASGNAYEQLKQLLNEKPAEIGNMTVHMDMSVTDNGVTAMNTVGDIKADKASKNSSGQIKVSGKSEEKVINFFSADKAVLFNVAGSENWYRTEARERLSRSDSEEQFGNDNADMKKLRGMLMDTLMGDMKDQVSLEESNGLRTFSLELNKGNMPLLVQTAFNAGSTRKQADLPDAGAMANLPSELQDLIGDLADYHKAVNISGEKDLQRISVKLTVNQDNKPVGADLSAAFSAMSTDGSVHNYETSLKASISDLNSTVPDQAGIDPSKAITIDPAQFEGICRAD
ncbi:MAG TPA: hypothetical protein VHT96_16065 [Clostridia bacterium]|nr:hypothetical protein [Clostridia bacterium]